MAPRKAKSLYSMWLYTSAHGWGWSQYFSTVSGSQVMIVCLLALSHNTSSALLKSISTLLKQLECENKATVASLAHSLAFSTGWQNNQGHSLPFHFVPGMSFLAFTPETLDQKCTQWLLTLPWAVILQTVSALSQNRRPKTDDISIRNDTVIIIISWARIHLWLVMWQVLWPIIDWIKLILRRNRKKKEGWEKEWWECERERQREKKLGEKKAVQRRAEVGTTDKRAEGKNVWAWTWECDSESEKARETENKLGTFSSQCHWGEAFHCQNYNSRFSDGAITSAGGNFV